MFQPMGALSMVLVHMTGDISWLELPYDMIEQGIAAIDVRQDVHDEYVTRSMPNMRK
jgi:hypothetical protein